MFQRIALFVFSLILMMPGTTGAQVTFRLATWNIEALGGSGSGQWNDALAVLGRMDADIVCVQEITMSNEAAVFPSFAQSANYPHAVVSGAAGTLSGSFYVGVMSRVPIVFSQSHTAQSLSGDPNANDITRDILEVHVQVPGTAQPLALFVVHLKASWGDTNDFRRAIEIHRLRQAIQGFKQANPGAPWAVCGDLNDDVGDGGFGNSFSSLPGGLPFTYSLGSDITFPVTYTPFQTLINEGGYLVDATQEDSTIDVTRPASGRRLDYIIAASSLQSVEDEVYNSALDNGVDDGQPGGLLMKAGSPLPSGTSLGAADHFMVGADLQLPSATPPLYPGTGEDLVMASGINGPATMGPGQEVKVAPPLNLFKVFFESPQGTFDFHVPWILGQLFVTGSPAPQGPLSGMYFDLNNVVILFDGWASPSGFPQVVVPGGTEQNYLIPAGLAGSSFIFQTVLYSTLASQGYVFTDAHRLDFQ